MRAYVVAVALLLAGCASDQYAVIPGSAASPAMEASDLRACKHQAIEEHFANRDHVGVIVGGLVGGALGGAIGGAIDGATGEERPSINEFTERCMKGRGYEGTSRG